MSHSSHLLNLILHNHEQKLESLSVKMWKNLKYIANVSQPSPVWSLESIFVCSPCIIYSIYLRTFSMTSDNKKNVFCAFIPLLWWCRLKKCWVSICPTVCFSGGVEGDAHHRRPHRPRSEHHRAHRLLLWQSGCHTNMQATLWVSECPGSH